MVTNDSASPLVYPTVTATTCFRPVCFSLRELGSQNASCGDCGAGLERWMITPRGGYGPRSSSLYRAVQSIYLAWRSGLLSASYGHRFAQHVKPISTLLAVAYKGLHNSCGNRKSSRRTRGYFSANSAVKGSEEIIQN